MRAAEVPNVPPVIDVEAEVAYWHKQHTDGQLPGSFGHYVLWIKFACDSLVCHPRASNEEREEAFQRHYALQIMPRLSEAQARDFIERCWDHVYVSSMFNRSERPRLNA